MLDEIKRDLDSDPFYKNNFPNDGQRFIAWYLRRVLLQDDVATKSHITDGADDKQIDAVIVDDAEQRIVIIQGKFIGERQVDAEPLREVLSAWMRLQDLGALQRDCNDKLKRKIEAIRVGLEDDYRVDFELLTTGTLTDAAQKDFTAFSDSLAAFDGFSASLHLVDTGVLDTRLAEANARALPSIKHTLTLDPTKTLVMDLPGAKTVIAALPLRECLTLPGITDGKLFAKNVRQSLGSSNKVNRELSKTIHTDKVRDFFFYHNGVTALCDSLRLNGDGTKMEVEGLSVVNGCQSLNTIYDSSERVRQHEARDAYILFRFYEIKDRGFGDRISVNTNQQSAVKPRDLRSNDRVMVGLKKAYETRFPDGMFLTKRGEAVPGDKDKAKVIDAVGFARMVMAWQCQRPNNCANERRLFDEYYKTVFKTGYAPESMLALQMWMNAIDASWANLNMNEELKATRALVKYHVLYAVSALLGAANNQTTLVVDPRATIPAMQLVDTVLPMAATCVDKAMQTAHMQQQTSGKFFNAQNWLKRNDSWTAENLVASTQASMMSSFPQGPALLDKMRVPVTAFSARWAAD